MTGKKAREMLTRDLEIMGRRRCRLCWVKEDENTADKLEQESKKRPDDGELHIKLACAYLKLCRFDKSIAAAKTAINNGMDNDRGYAQLGRAYIESGQLEEGREASLNAFKMNSDNITAIINLAVYNSLIGDYEAAMDYFEIAEKITPYYHRLYGERGLHYARVGMIAEALDELKTAIKYDPCNHTHYHNMSDIYMKNGLMDDAHKTLEMSLENRPGCAESYHSLAQICAEKDMRQEAIKNIDTAIRIHPENEEFHHFKRTLTDS